MLKNTGLICLLLRDNSWLKTLTNSRLSLAVAGCLTTETVEGAALSLQGMDDVKSSDGLAASMLGVGDGVTNDVLQEHLQDTAGLLVDETGDALDTTSANDKRNVDR